VNFAAGDYQDNDLAAPLSSSGQQTITNHSSGTVDVVVSVRGYFLTPEAPAPPGSVSATASGSSAAVTWTAPGVDGGAPVTGYTITSWPDNQTVTVGGSTSQATLTGLASAADDTFTVSATNAVGTGAAATYSPPNVVSGTVVAPDAASTPVAGNQVSIIVNDPNATAATPSVLGTATTDAQGNWFFTVPPYSSLPADAQAAADGNGGILNVEAIAMGTATADSAATGSPTQYTAAAVGAESAWTGSSAGGQAPAAGSIGDPGMQPAMVMRPQGTDTSSQITPAAEQATWTWDNSPVMTDSSGNIIGNPGNAYPPVPTDAYGYQEIGGDGTYNPNQAADGTDLTNVPVSSRPPACYNPADPPTSTKFIRQSHSWTIVGEYHSNWNDMGRLTYDTGAETSISVLTSVSASDFHVSGSTTNSAGSGVSATRGNLGTFDSHQVLAWMRYRERKLTWDIPGLGFCYSFYQWENAGIVNPNAAQTRWRTDGEKALENLLDNHPRWKHFNHFGFDDCVKHDKGVSYGFGAGIEYNIPDGPNVSLSFETQTTHSSATEQCFEADASNGVQVHATRPDPFNGGRQDERHYFWGSSMNFNWNGGTEPRTFYTY
jgi:hypothetical protein